MNDDEIAAAFRRLVDAAEPPSDAAARVTALGGRRRRTRVAGVVALSVALVAGASGIAGATLGGDDGDRRAGLVATDPPSGDALVEEWQENLSCPAGTQHMRAMTYPIRFTNFTRLLKRYQVPERLARVDRTRQTFSTYWTTRGAAKVREVVRWSGDPDTGWAVDSVEGCYRLPGKEPPPTATNAPQSRQRVRVDIGHCWIEPFEVDGSLWEPIDEDQGGGGGLLPDDFVGEGKAWTAGDLAFYRDDSGKLLTLVPEGDPWARDHDVQCR